MLEPQRVKELNLELKDRKSESIIFVQSHVLDSIKVSIKLNLFFFVAGVQAK